MDNETRQRIRAAVSVRAKRQRVFEKSVLKHYLGTEAFGKIHAGLQPLKEDAGGSYTRS